MSNSFSPLSLLKGDQQADRVVPPTGFTARLTLFASAAMVFLAVFALALSLATGRMSANWSQELARSSTLRISAPADQIAAQTEQALRVLETTRGVARARALSDAEQKALLEPWFGPDVPVESLPIPQLIEVIEDAEGYDPAGLRLRLAAEVPGAVLDDHGRWRRPLVAAAERVRALGVFSLVLIGGVMAAMITLAANSALAANAQVITVLRLVGAQDSFIARAFVRRFTFRAFWGALIGLALGLAALMALPDAQPEGGFLTGLGLRGWSWIWPFFLPPVAAMVSFFATRSAARRMLQRLA